MSRKQLHQIYTMVELEKQKDEVETWLRNLYARPQDELGYDQIDDLNRDIMECEDLLREINSSIAVKQLKGA